MRDKIKSLLQQDIIIYSIMIAISFILSSSLFSSGYLIGHDTVFHISVLNAIKESINLGNTTFQILPLIARNFGYGVGLFYAPFSYFITILISLVIPSIYSAMKVVHALTIFLSMFTMFRFLKDVTKSKFVSLSCAILYISFPYFLSDFFIRDAYAESMSFIFIPLIFHGLYELIYLNNTNKFYIYFIIGSVLLTLTHNITALYCAIFAFIFLLFNIKKLIREKKIKAIVIALLFVIGMSSFYLIPVIIQKIYGNIRVFSSVHTIVPADNELILSDFWNINQTEVSFLIPFTIIILLVLSIIKYKTSKIDNKKFFLVCGILGLFALFMTTNLFPWDYAVSLLTYIQFPWRLLLFVDFFFSVFIAIGISSCKRVLSKIVVSLLVFSTIIISLSSQTISIGSYNLLDRIDTSFLGLGYDYDYMPMKVVNNIDYYENRSSEIIIEAGEGTTTINSLIVPTIDFSAQVDSGPLIVELPLLYYYGYSCNDCNISESPNGFVEVIISQSGNYTVSYTGTNLYAVAYFISLSSFIIFIAFIAYNKYGII